MSIILDQKEEVLNLELTKHGKKLFGLGIFDPKYFSFFDDTIIYDNSYFSINEDINSIQDRILNNSLTFKSPNLIEDVLMVPLGTSKTTSDFAPSWDLQFLNGKISSVENSSYYKKVFITEDIVYNIYLDERDPVHPVIKDDYLLIDLKELNMQEDIDNFEIEIITYDELSGGKEAGLGRKLYFSQAKNNVIDNILFEENELPSRFFDVKLSEEDVSYYLDVLVDEEIDADFIVAKETELKEKVKESASIITPPPEPC